MRLSSVPYLLVLGSLALAGPVRAQDVEAGNRIARTWCSNCHVVDRQTRGNGNDTVPSFPAIAAMKATTAASLTAFLITSHGRMPDFSLTRAEIKDVAAYIISLRASASF